MALPPQQFCVRWNSYHTNLQSWFPRLLLSEQFADVTLACESRQLRCHKIVLSACSAYLERLLSQNPCKHPIVLMRDMRFSEMQALVDFMYKGEVNVTQEELPSLLKSAEALQIRGLCSSESAGSAGAGGGAGGAGAGGEPRDRRDYSLASDQLLASHCTTEHINGQSGLPPQKAATPPTPPPNGTKKKEEHNTDVKEETVEEDGLYYGELDNDHMEYNEDEDTGKPGSSLGQTSDYPIANVQCQYDSPSDTEPEGGGAEGVGGAGGPTDDHTYGVSARAPRRVASAHDSDEPPAFLIHQTSQVQTMTQFSELAPKIMTIGPGYPTVNVIHVGDQPPATTLALPINTTVGMSGSQPEYSINKRIRRSEEVLRQAADCVSRGHTFQTVSEQFNIPISTIRFFMARKGILPRRRRGRTTQAVRLSSSPEPPFHMQHYKLPDLPALRIDDDSQHD